MPEDSDMPAFVTLGMFIIDEFSFLDDDGQPTGKTLSPQENVDNHKFQIGGGGTYAAIGARIWLSEQRVGMIVDRGRDFPAPIYEKLLEYGSEMWAFRDQPGRCTTRALNSYRGDYRNFEYLTPRVRITPSDLHGTRLARCPIIHFICSPTRASAIMSEVLDVEGWSPTTIYEPIPDRCVPDELPALIEVLPLISILSPNAEEALSLLSLPLPPTKSSIEEAAEKFLNFGIGDGGNGCIIIRSGGMGAFLKTRIRQGKWVDAFWNGNSEDVSKIVDVTGAGNSFLGGLAAGLLLTHGDPYEASFYASVSASFTIEQEGLPMLSANRWNGDLPQRRLKVLQTRHGKQ